MITLGLLALLVNVYSSDTVIISSSGYNNVLQRGMWNSLYFERQLNKELNAVLEGWDYSSWDSLSGNLYRNSYNAVGLYYIPKNWLTLKGGLTGSRSGTEEVDGTQGYARSASYLYLETIASMDYLYTDYYIKYGQDRTAPSGPLAGWTLDHTRIDDATISLKIPVCTLSVFHNYESHANWTDAGDTLKAGLPRIKILKGYFLSGAELGRRRKTGYSDYEELGANFWMRDTFPITPNVGLRIEASYDLDTLTDNLQEYLIARDDQYNLSTRLGYKPFRQTTLGLLFENEQSYHDQVEEYYDENVRTISFTGSLNQNFSSRPSYAKGLLNRTVNFISPGYINFSHSVSLEQTRTPDTSNALDRDKFSERLTFSTTLKPGENLSTTFNLNHTIQLTHYVDTINTSYASNSNERKTSYAYWKVDFDIPDYLELSNSSSLSFDWTRYYSDSTQNRADRIWTENLSVAFFPEAVLEPGIDFKWERYENWRMLSGALARSGLKDKLEQRYSISFVRKRKEEAPRWWWQGWWEQEWLRITGFAGVRIEKIPAEMQGLWQESKFAGLDLAVRPWPYVSINGGMKFIRSNYEVPFEASLSVYSSF